MTTAGMWDLHVHSNRSWDTPEDSTIARMAETARRAGLTGIAITDHFDCVPGGDIVVRRPGDQFDVVEHVRTVTEARAVVADVQLLVGLEYGEPHLAPRELERVRASAALDIVLGSVHAVIDRGELVDLEELVHAVAAPALVRRYLEDVLSLVENTAVDVLAHIELPYRYMPTQAHDPRFDLDLYARIFHTAAQRGIAVEYNTKSERNILPALEDVIRAEPDLQFTVGGDGHFPHLVGSAFDRARAYLESIGRRPNPVNGRWTSGTHCEQHDAAPAARGVRR